MGLSLRGNPSPQNVASHPEPGLRIGGNAQDPREAAVERSVGVDALVETFPRAAAQIPGKQRVVVKQDAIALGRNSP